MSSIFENENHCQLLFYVKYFSKITIKDYCIYFYNILESKLVSDNDNHYQLNKISSQLSFHEFKIT